MTHDDDLLPGLKEFGHELQRAAREREQPARRKVRRGRLGAVLIAGSLVLVGGAGAAGLLTTGEPVKPRNDAPSGSRPASPALGVVTLVARDPQGGFPWGARVYRSKDGSECIVAGRLRGSQIGVIKNRVFRPLGAGAYGACAQLSARRFVFTVGHVVDDLDRTLVYGRAGSSVREVQIRTPDGTRRTKLRPGGAFLLVFDGKLDAGDVRVAPIYVKASHRARQP